MKKLFTLFFFAATATLATAQSFSSPESVERNLPDNSYFISNTGTGEILKMLPNGTLQNFASGLTSGPHGLELVGDTLYACDGSSLRLFNRTTGALINSVNLGATFLNGITHKGKDLFITDFSAKKIYRFDTKTNVFNVFVNSLTKTPNGIIYDYINDRLVFVCWGSSAPVYEVNLSDSTTTLLTTTTVGNIDGIAMNCDGNFYISSWSPNAIRFYDSDFAVTSVLTTTGISSPADIYFDASKDTLYVPNSGSGNNVVKVYAPSCIVTGMDEWIYDNIAIAYPNPTTGIFTLHGIRDKSKVEVYSLTGKSVYAQTVSQSSSNIDISNLSQGIYFVKIASGNDLQTIKICKQ